MEKEQLNRKDLRDYIHNVLGIKKDDIRKAIQDEIELIVKEEVTICMHDQERLRRLIENEIVRQLKFYDPLKHTRTQYIRCTVDEIYNQIDEEIHKVVCDRLQLTLKEPIGRPTYGYDGNTYVTNISGSTSEDS